MEDLEEKWLEIVGYPGYFISNMGYVRSTKQGRNIILKPTINVWGYAWVYISNNGIKKGFAMHRLVGIYFIPNRLNLPQIDHIRNPPNLPNKLDNRYFMLEWVTNLENNRRARLDDLYPLTNGVKHGMSKLTEKDILEIRSSKLQKKKIADLYNISVRNVYYIITKESWAHI